MKNEKENSIQAHEEKIADLQVRLTETKRAGLFWKAKYEKTRELIGRFVNELTDKELAIEVLHRTAAAHARRIETLEERIVELSKPAEGDTKT